MFVRDGERESRGRRWAVARGTTGWLFDQMTVSGQLSDRVDIVFRPSIEAAAATVDLDEIWSGEIVSRDVPVR